jgi:two-component system nitrate/nitrite response regulator NarL
MQILVVDDHPAVSTGLAQYLKEIEPDVPEQAPLDITAVTTLSEALTIVGSEDPPDLVFLDLSLGEGNSGAATLERLQRGNPHRVPVVIYTGLGLRAPGTVDTLLKCYNKLAAHSIILKSATAETVLVGLPRILAGERWLPQDVFDALVGWSVSSPKQSIRLTPIEKQVADRLARGWTDKQIANDLKKSRHYIRQVNRHIFEKLGVHTRLEALIEMQKAGLVSITEDELTDDELD